MSKRIVIMPTFAEAPMIKCQIPNIVATLKPDVVIYNEGVFPMGPENGSMVDHNFRNKFCGDGGVGFDFNETVAVIAQAKIDYPHVRWILGSIDYPSGMKAEDAYTYAVSTFEDYDITIEEGDIIFPSEADVFHLESDVDYIDELVSNLKPDEGISSTWWDFGATQCYVEQRLHPDVNTVTRSRRFAVCFGTMEYYKSVAQSFVTQKYTNTRLVDLRTYHYPMFRQGKYLELRLTMLRRQQGYWENYMIGHNEQINETTNATFKPSIMIRPTLTGNYRFVKYIDTNHPMAIMMHPCYIPTPIKYFNDADSKE
tara:strand:- start:33 stop:968 length:936 start_codon:yes stop_codon:yes gene_type:complete